MLDRFLKKTQRKNRIRAKISGDSKRPRLAVSTSNKHITAQIIDDTKGSTLIFASDIGLTEKLTKTEASFKVGEMVAEKAKKINVETIVFDRGGKLYHGRVKALAEGARKGGLKF